MINIGFLILATTADIGIQTNMDLEASSNDVTSVPVTNGHVVTGDVTPQVTLEVNQEQSDEEESEGGSGVPCVVENNSFLARNFGRPKSRTFDDYAAMRLASPFLPSPVLERRTVL